MTPRWGSAFVPYLAFRFPATLPFMGQHTESRISQRGRILGLLLDARGSEVPAPELARISLQYSARVLELRRLGFRIVNRVETVAGVRRGFFRLVSGPVAVTSPAPAAAVPSVQAPLSPTNQQILFTERHRDDG